MVCLLSAPLRLCWSYEGCALVHQAIACARTDHLYSTTAITDDAGNVVERYTYDAYGKRYVRDDGGALKDDQSGMQGYGFTGRRLDGESGLWYFRARYFDDELGRFVGRDPLLYVDGMNRYAAYFVPLTMDFSGFKQGNTTIIHRIWRRKIPWSENIIPVAPGNQSRATNFIFSRFEFTVHYSYTCDSKSSNLDVNSIDYAPISSSNIGSWKVLHDPHIRKDGEFYDVGGSIGITESRYLEIIVRAQWKRCYNSNEDESGGKFCYKVSYLRFYTWQRAVMGADGSLDKKEWDPKAKKWRTKSLQDFASRTYTMRKKRSWDRVDCPCISFENKKTKADLREKIYDSTERGVPFHRISLAN